MSKHTPTPWFAPRDGSMRDERGNCIPIYSGFIEEAFHCEQPAIDNAAFIVRAVNSHDALVEAVEEAISAIRHVLRVSLDIDDARYQATLDKLNAALASANTTTGERE